MSLNRKYERPEVKQITRQWVRENCKNITERDLGLLKIIQQHRIIRRDQLQVLYPEFPSTDFLNKRLKMMYQKHLIDRIYPAVGLGKGSPKQHVCLDRAGAILLDLEKFNKPIQIDQQGVRSLPLGWEHRIALNQYKCSIVEVCKSLDAQLKLCWIERPYVYNDTKIIPDITCLILHKGKGHLFFLEVDLGTEDTLYIKKKTDNYKDYYVSKRWYNEKWAQVFKTPVFPQVLFFTENGRAKRKNALEDYTRDSAVSFMYGFHEHFKSSLTNMLNG